MNKLSYRSYEYVINDNIDLVYKIINKLNYNLVIFDELLNAGFKGLYQAIRKFDLQVHQDFAKFAVKYIVISIKGKSDEK